MNHMIAKQLEQLVQRDLETRSKLLETGKLYGRYDEEMQRVHRDNAGALAEIIDAHGWPGASLVGEGAARNAWLIAQHSICTPDLQRRFLEYLAVAADSGDATVLQVAMLTDRIRFNKGKPQVYGLVLDWNENGELDCELEDPDNVDARRRAVGLGTFQQSLREQRDAVAKEGGRPSEDLAAYRQAADAWSIRTGWRNNPKQ